MTPDEALEEQVRRYRQMTGEERLQIALRLHELSCDVAREGIRRQYPGVTPEEVVPEASFIDDLGADSLDIVELVMALEEEFGVSIPDESAEKIKTVGDAVDFIVENV